MRVKIGDTYYSSDDQPILIILDDNDKELISNMSEDNNAFGAYPDDMSKEEMVDFMKVDCDIEEINWSDEDEKEPSKNINHYPIPLLMNHNSNDVVGHVTLYGDYDQELIAHMKVKNKLELGGCIKCSNPDTIVHLSIGAIPAVEKLRMLSND